MKFPRNGSYDFEFAEMTTNFKIRKVREIKVRISLSILTVKNFTRWKFSLSSEIFHCQWFFSLSMIFFTVKWNISLSSCDFFHCQLIFQWNQVKITNWWWCIPIIKIFHKFDCQISYVAYPMCQKCSRTCPFCLCWGHRTPDFSGELFKFVNPYNRIINIYVD